MRVSVGAFQAAIEQWQESLSFLSEAEPYRDADGKIIFTNSKHFVDCFFDDSGQRYMLSMPLSNEALTWAKRSAVYLRTLSSSVICHYEVMPAVLRVRSGQRLVNVDLVCEYLPKGKILSRVIERVEPQALYSAAADLFDEYERIGVMHSNLAVNNIIFTDDGRMVPLRYQYMDKYNGILAQNEFDRLLSWIERKKGVERPVGICLAEPENRAPAIDLTDYDWHSNYCEGFCVVRRGELYGYVDMSGVEVIKPQYLWANDMHEGRAEVKTAGGMGLIDGRGRYVIDPRYEVVDYDMSSNCVMVRQAGLWARFDYNGFQMTPFAPLDEMK